MEFQFKDQLTVGADGESLFLKIYPWLNKADGIKFDFERNGKTVELKTDTYSMDSTPNFFMESIGSIDSGKPGGPWRAALDGVDYFVYMFIKQKKCFWFDSKELVKFLDKYCEDLNVLSIRNQSWTTLGYLVPRSAVKHLVIKESP